jgi:trehalose utilization protein
MNISMPAFCTRRGFIHASSAATTTLLASAVATADDSKIKKSIRVVVWDEQQREQKEVYDNFLGNWLAKYLESRPGFTVKSVRLDDPEQGLSAETLDACDVLVWWGHKRNREVKAEKGKKIVERIKAGTLGLVALHSAHWSTPFVEAMNERTRHNAEREYGGEGKDKVEFAYITPAQNAPRADARLTPCAVQQKFPDGKVKVTVHLPICCFPAYRADGKPSQIRILKPEHPIVQPREFEIPRTEMYNEPFHVPDPDEVVLEERWATGEWFRSGMVWNIGKGRVFYFRPGHETFGVYKEKPALQIVENAVRWLGQG